MYNCIDGKTAICGNCAVVVSSLSIVACVGI